MSDATDSSKSSIDKFRSVLSAAMEAKRNEADTIRIIEDMLVELCGYDRLSDFSSEERTAGRRLDILVSHNGKKRFIVEAKAVNVSLDSNGRNESYVAQAGNYTANNNLKHCVLSNGAEWRIYKLCKRGAMRLDLVASVNLLSDSFDFDEAADFFAALSVDGFGGEKLESLGDNGRWVTRYLVGNILTSDSVAAFVRDAIAKASGVSTISVSGVKKVIGGLISPEVVESSPKPDAAIIKAARSFKVNAAASERSDAPVTASATVCCGESPVFFCTRKGAKAMMRLTDNGYTILEGSTVAVPSDQFASNSPSSYKLRATLEANGTIRGGVFTRPHEFDSPSAAASVVCGNSENGKAAWKTEDGMTLGDYLRGR